MAEEAQAQLTPEPTRDTAVTTSTQSETTTQARADVQTAPSETTQELAIDTEDGTLLASGEVNYNGKGHKLLLMQKGLRLVQEDSDGPLPVVDVPWREVMCACEPSHKKLNTVSKVKKLETSGAAPSKTFVVHYMIRNAKTKKLQCTSISLESKQETAEEWIVQIEDKCKEGKPRTLLVIINPIGGKGNARQVFDKRVQPLFALAGVELVVKVTERAQHATEIARTFDVASVDGVVVMGGDGLYMEVLHGLILRKQEEEGVDYNDPDATLVPPAVRVGVIPAGTGNGVSGWFNGVIDIDTATLNITQGQIARANIFAVHEGKKLVQYAGLCIGNGFFSSLIKRTDELRWMKTMRYPYVMATHVFGKKKMQRYDVEILKNEQDQTSKKDGTEAGDANAATVSGWSSLGTKETTAAFCMATRITEGAGGRMVMNPFRPGFDLLFFDRASALDTLHFFFTFATQKISGFHRPSIEWVSNIRGARFQLVQQTTEGASGSAQDTELLELSKMVDIDGEFFTLSEPKFEIQLHSQFLQVFTSPDSVDTNPPP